VHRLKSALRKERETIKELKAKYGATPDGVEALTAIGVMPRANAGGPAPDGGRAELLTLLFMLALLGRGFWRLPRKSGGPPLFAPSLKVKGDDTHNNSGFSVIDASITKQLPGAVRMAMGTSVFQIRIELIFRRC
jgi:hypothetical protein